MGIYSSTCRDPNSLKQPSKCTVTTACEYFNISSISISSAHNEQDLSLRCDTGTSNIKIYLKLQKCVHVGYSVTNRPSSVGDS